MLNPFTLLHAMSGIDAGFILEGAAFLENSKERKAYVIHRRWRVALIAALLALLLAACGLAVYRATMQHRAPHPEDEMRYYLNGTHGPGGEPMHLELNFGECAMVQHFETEEKGTAHAFRLRPGAAPEEWLWGGSTLKSFLNGFSPESAEFLASLPEPKTLPEDLILPLEQSLREAGVTEEEAEEWYTNLTWQGEEREDTPKMIITLQNGPNLCGIDLIYGWPKGEATVVREEEYGEYQLLETQIDIDWGDYHQKLNYLFLFHPTKQYLLTISAESDTLSFSQMEEIADSIEILDTGFSYYRPPSDMNWSNVCFAFG